MARRRTSIFLLPLLLLLLPGCSKDESSFDLEQIRQRGKLIALTGYDGSSYFIYKGRPMGYEFDLLSLLANHLGVKLEMVVLKDRNELFARLKQGDGDIVAASMTVTSERAEEYTFTEPLMSTYQVLVQKRPENWRSMRVHEIEQQMIRNPLDLAGKTVHVRTGSSYHSRLENLSEEIGGGINIMTVAADVSTDELIRRVANGEIELTLADENIAKINQAYYSDLDIATPVSFPQRIAWAVRENAPEFLNAINEWLREAKKGPTYHVIYRTYFENARSFRGRLALDKSIEAGGKISPYDDLIKDRASSIGWDWRLLAAQIYQESLFDPRAASWAGAVGLMQLLPETAMSFGATDLHDPAENLSAGTSYLRWLEKYWHIIPDSTERRKFVLASYNAGFGHVEDARRLALKYGADQNKWDGHVETFMVNLSDEVYYSDEVVRNGYCRGEETVSYVSEIMDRYEHYKRFIGPTT
ncbi:MAG: transporter substrate-binding domain-containing protein [Ignavibacteria bacterium]|nr:transporter substrate-binding domain-containing protein [Ignavibacteria bacterium]